MKGCTSVCMKEYMRACTLFRAKALVSLANSRKNIYIFYVLFDGFFAYKGKDVPRMYSF